jgi:DNA-binding beta-propeller fold protein YncE
MIKGSASVRMPFNSNPLSENEITVIKDWIDNGAADESGAIPFSNPSYRVFVCNQKADAISVIDGDAKLVSRVYDTDFSEINDAPHMVAVYGDYFYVTYIADGSFVKFNKETGEILGRVEQLEFPGMIMITSDGAKAFVSRSSSAPGSYNSIYSIDLKSMTVINEILLPVSGIPHGIALSPDDKTLYVANLTANRISLVNAETDSFIEDLSFSSTVDHEPMQAALSPDGKYLYLSARATGKLLIVDTEQLSLVKEVMVGMMPMHIAVSNDGSKIYVPSMMMNTVSLVEFDGTDWNKTKEITNPAFQQIHGCALSPDNNYLYVSSRNVNGNFVPAYQVQGESNLGTIAIINTSSFTVEKVLEIETYGAGIAVD